MAFSTIFILLICGICTNMVSAIFGIGGGVLMVPILRTLFPALPIFSYVTHHCDVYRID